MSHTPGPWDTQPTAGHETHGQSAVYDANGKDIAIVYDGDANARLISAAPALLEACKKATKNPPRDGESGCCVWCQGGDKPFHFDDYTHTDECPFTALGQAVKQAETPQEVQK